MATLIKNAIIIDKASSHHGKKMDLLINKGKIERIARTIKAEAKTEVIKGKSLHVSPGWIDIGTHLGEPGLEHRETIKTAAKAALAGGFTRLAPFPNTNPPVQTKSSVTFLVKEAKSNGIKVYPLGALSQDLKGQDITEMLDLYEAGCVGFTDGLKGIENAGLLLRALQYNKRIQAAIIQQPYDQHICEAGLMHEGVTSTLLGMKGIPSMTEYTRVKRDLDINKYVGSTLTLHCISTAESVRLLKEAAKDQSVNATVSYLHLLKIDEDLSTFDTNLKVVPPLRSSKDRSALIKGLINGQIQAIVSNHQPLDTETKDLEFPYAKSGASGLESVFAALNTYAKNLTTETIVHALTHGPANILKVKLNSLETGTKANLTVFDPTSTWTYSTTKSKSKNNPFLGQELTGKVIKTF